MDATEAQISEAFSDSYEEARKKFRRCVKSLPDGFGVLKSCVIGSGELRGPFGESLTQDFAIIRSPKGAGRPIRKVLVHSSGTHGVEGFAGSAIQIRLLRSFSTEIEPFLDEDTVVVMIHAVNPFGMAWHRRWNPNNVDLNRNCIFVPGTLQSDDKLFTRLTSNPPEDYLKLSSLMNPTGRRGICDCFKLKALLSILWYGYSRAKQAAAGGQYFNENGIYFGGFTVEREPRRVMKMLTENGLHPGASDIEKFIHIDVHTGLGPWAKDTLLCEGAVTTVRRITGHEGEENEIKDPSLWKVQDNSDESGPSTSSQSIAYETHGSFVRATRTLAKSCAEGQTQSTSTPNRAKSPGRSSSVGQRSTNKSGNTRTSNDAFIGFVQEFGTYSGVDVFGALRAEHAALRENPGLSLDAPERQQVKKVFYPPSDSWRQCVLRNGVDVFRRCLQHISSNN